MTPRFEALDARPQEPLADTPFDRWVTEDGDIAAEFYRRGDGQFLVRFPEQADFTIALGEQAVQAIPQPDLSAPALDTLYRNSVLPIIGNHLGGLNMHGSAVTTPNGALAFMGLSRRGKTTLAGAFAAAGNPFLTEDTVALERDEGAYLVQPMRPVLRVFGDSAEYLLGDAATCTDADTKSEVDASGKLPFAEQPAPLRHIFLLGPGDADEVTITRLGEAQAMVQLMQQAFVLDVEDKPRLRAHFDRIATLAGSVECHALDYPRRYDQLPRVIAAILAMSA